MTFDPKRVSQSEIAAILGVSDRTVRNLTIDGVLREVDKAKYDLHATVKAYVGYIARGRVATERSAQRNALESERVRRLRIENDRDEGLSVPLMEFQAAMNAVMLALGTALDILPNRHSAELAIMNDAGKIKHRLRDITVAIREDCASRVEGLADRAQRSGALARQGKPRARRVG